MTTTRTVADVRPPDPHDPLLFRWNALHAKGPRLSVRDLWILLRDSRVLVIAGMAIGLAGSLFAYAWLPTAYTASTSMYVVATGPTPQSAFLGAQLSTERMATYADLLTSPRVADAVIDKLRLPDTPDELIDTFDARNKNKSTAIQLDEVFSVAG
ncbi:Wzz/FepE/Etk N-terminal domain-containing protein [Pseudonocardia sp. Ae505_Ps2]|uniref:Wzz/FepE/Etk N-terminal domain-containing protein n=1 Tax=Pseudonocardia sp. Ae505_Ps2 TaxID=1885034 RepID=UPI000963025D|nr:Wzz/FepE/Etk N-terminal domain-containing protein [Pseudonocardia sp. Ae505_Ps2]OLM14156.1 hypothetical protein Ae505Ps2_4286c [Pseudonocardia sp. Ae505_Ps2]